MSEYNIPVLVKGDLPRRSDWNDNALNAIGCVLKMRDIGDGFFADVHGIWWDPRQTIPNPTPSQIEEEARKAGKGTVTTEKREPKLYEFWKLNDGRTAWLEPDRTHNPADFIARVMRGGWGPDRDCEDRTIGAEANFIRKREIDRPSTTAEIEAWIAKCGKPAKYTPEAAQSAQKGPMDPKSETSTTSVIKKAKETAAVKALREAEAKAESDQVRIAAIRLLVALEEEKRKAREKLRDIDDQIATLSKKWLKGVGK